MMMKQSKDWILGYVFSRLEKYIIEGHMKKLDNIDNHIISVPKNWFGLQATKNSCVTFRLPEIKEMTIAEIEKELGYKIKVIGDKT